MSSFRVKLCNTLGHVRGVTSEFFWGSGVGTLDRVSLSIENKRKLVPPHPKICFTYLNVKKLNKEPKQKRSPAALNL